VLEPKGPDEVDVDAAVGGYDGWLTRQPLAARTRDAYLAQARDFVTWLAGFEHGARALVASDVRDWAVRDYKRYVKTTKRWGPASVNQALAAIDNFYRSRGAGRPEVAREELAQTAPRALTEAEQRTFLRFAQACPSARDRAIATVFFYAGLRLSELGALDMTDVALSARRGRVTVRAGKGDAYRHVPLSTPCRTALDEWFDARTKLEFPRFRRHPMTERMRSVREDVCRCPRPRRIPRSSSVRPCSCCARAAGRCRSWPRSWACRRARCATGPASVTSMTASLKA
jgi:integrase